MISLGRFLGGLIVLWAFFYTLSYGNWTWKNKNRFGAVMIYLVAITELVLPIYVLFFKN